MLKRIAILIATGLLAGAVGTASAADYGKREFKVVGSWPNMKHWQVSEKPFWEDVIPEASGGALTANVKPLTELGLSGFELMRLLKLGVYDAAHIVLTYATQDSPAMEGADLAGVVQDLPTYRKAIDAYRDIIARELADKYNAQLIMLYAWPSQQLFCNLGDRSMQNVPLSMLKGKKIRTYSTPLGDFIEGLQASAVTIAFAEVVPSLQKGVADCGITGTLPAYQAKWWQVVTHNIQVSLGFAASMLAMNKKTWDSLTPDARALFMSEGAKLEDRMWKDTFEMDDTAIKCNTTGPCDIGPVGHMVPVVPSEADRAMVRKIVADYVLPRWAKRCGTEKCINEWNASIGTVVDMTISN